MHWDNIPTQTFKRNSENEIEDTSTSSVNEWSYKCIL